MIRRSSTTIRMMYCPSHCANAFGFDNAIMRFGYGSRDLGNTLSPKPSHGSIKPEPTQLISADIIASVAGWINLEPTILSRGCSD
ncbi:MAG: hypothetical protein AAFW84_04420 [Cyanobacteria bacterium J06635_15]